MTDLTALRNFAQQKSAGISSATVDFTDFVDAGQHTLFNLPPDCLITGAYCLPLEPSQASVTATFQVSTTAGTTNMVTVNMASSNASRNNDLVTPTLTGARCFTDPSVLPTKGRFVFIVEYIEYTVTTGKLTNYGE